MTMGLELTRPFAAYVSIEAFPSRGDARRFVLHLRFELEGTWDSGELTWPWEYADAPQDSDGRSRAGGYEGRLAQEMDNFRRHVEYELELGGQRIYERAGSDGLVLAQQQPRTDSTAPRAGA
jgi:hypothetical protein